MSENVGSISWTVDADTSGAVNSIKGMATQVANAEKSLDKLDNAAAKTNGKLAILEKATKDYTNELLKNGNTISSTGVVLDKYGMVNASATKHIQGLTAANLKMSKIAEGVNAALSGMGRNMGMAGIQVQQFVGQLQGGQNAMVALSQQGADLGFVLGAPLVGAIVGISASIVGMLIPSLMNSKTGAEELTKVLGLLKGVATETSSGAIVLSASLEKLAKKSKALAEIEIALGMVNAQKAIKAASKEILDASDEWENLFSFVNLDSAVNEIKNLEAVAKRMGLTQVEVMNQIGDSYGGSISEITQITEAVNQVGKEFGTSQAQSLGFLKSIEELKKSKSPEAMAAVAAAVHEMAMSMDSPNEKLLTLDKRLGEAAYSAMSAAEMLKLLKEAGGDVAGVLDRSGESALEMSGKIDTLVESLQQKVKALKEDERQTALRIATENNATDAQLASIDAAYQKIQAHEASVKSEKELQSAMEKSARESASEAKRKEREAASEIKRKERLEVAEVKRIQREAAALRKANVASAQSIIESGKTETTKRREKIAELEKLRDEDLENEATYQAAINEIQNKQEVTKTEAVQATQSIIGGGESPEQQAITAKQEMLAEYYEQGLIDEQMFQDALTAIQKEGEQARVQSAALVLSSFSNSFGQLADVLANSEGEQSAAYKSMFALSKGFAVASAALNFALAVSEASKLPWPANLGAIAFATAQGASLVSAVSSATYSGRENGGSVIGGQTYEVGEKNKPELLMIPGNKGKVFSNAEAKGMMGGGAQLNQTINNYAGADGYQVRTRGDGITAPQVIDIIRSEMGNANSYSRRSLGSTSNVQNKARSRR